jgi:hypothetical protein
MYQRFAYMCHIAGLSTHGGDLLSEEDPLHPGRPSKDAYYILGCILSFFPQS